MFPDMNMTKYLDYLRSSKKYIYIITVIFVISLIGGLLVSLKYPGLSENYLLQFKESFGWIKSLDPLSILLVIFLNNALKSLMALVTGIGFGIIPVFFVVGNGVALTMMAGVVSKEHGLLFVVLALLPHGMIEIPMILISTGIGLRLGHLMYLYFIGNEVDLKTELKMGVGVFLRIIAPLLFLAAIIETFVTPFILKILV